VTDSHKLCSLCLHICRAVAWGGLIVTACSWPDLGPLAGCNKHAWLLGVQYVLAVQHMCTACVCGWATNHLHRPPPAITGTQWLAMHGDNVVCKISHASMSSSITTMGAHIMPRAAQAQRMLFMWGGCWLDEWAVSLGHEAGCDSCCDCWALNMTPFVFPQTMGLCSVTCAG
jgi:hypothetical protein